jgi:hypothetical protein
MLEKDNIQSRGFRNVTEGGKVVGFQIPFRSTYYRGVWIPQLTEATITVDGEKFEGTQITWTIGGKTYAQAEMDKYPDVHWPNYEAAILTVKKSGGLPLGLHDVEVAYGYSVAYTPYPENGWASIRTYKRKMSLVS